MDIHEKELVRQVVNAYLEREAPEQVQELELVFEISYHSVQLESAARDPTSESRDASLQFGPSSMKRTLINAAIWIADLLIRAVLQSTTSREASRRLVELASRLAEHTGRYALVQEMYQLVVVVIPLISAERRRGQSETVTGPQSEGEPQESILQGPTFPDTQPDLQLLVHEERPRPGEVRMTYYLNARDASLGLALRRFDLAPAQRDPIEYFAGFFQSLKALTTESARDPLVGEKKLAARGIKLFKELLPVDLQRVLWSLHTTAKTLQVVTEESWIPWEMLKFQDPDDRGSIGPFFGEALALTRCPPASQTALHLPLRSLAWVAPRDVNLPSAEDERQQILVSLAGSDRSLTELSATFLEVTEAFADRRFDGWHFTGHGLAHGNVPDNWCLQLEDTSLSVTDLAPFARPSDAGERSLVFLNACHTARGGLSLIAVSGLANAFLDAGAGAVVGSYCTIGDRPAAAFAGAFYQHFLKGLAIGEAARQARLEVRQAFPGDPTGLAYTVIAHPAARADSPR